MGKVNAKVARITGLLRSMKADMNKARSFDFSLYFPAEASARAAAGRLVADGFTVTVSPSEAGDNAWWCATSRHVVPTDQELSGIIEVLEALAAEFGGEYDGWATLAS